MKLVAVWAASDLKGEDVPGVVARVDVVELPEAAHEERGSNQQDDGGGGLQRHERIPRDAAAADDASSGLLDAAHERTRQANGGDQTERARRQH